MKTFSIKSALAISLAAAFGTAALPAAAAPIGFDPDGGGALAPVYGIAAFDWAPGNILSQDGNQAVANFLNGTGSVDATIFGQFKLSAFLDSANNPIASGLGSAYEVTAILGFAENIGFVLPPPIGLAGFNFGTAGGATPSFFQMWVSPVNAVDLTGANFADGVNVLSGTIAPGVAFISNFTATQSANVALDQHGVNNWLGTTSVTGGGTTTLLDILNITTNPAYILASIASLTLELSNTSSSLPYNTVDPSQNLTDAAGLPVASNVGSKNGGLTLGPLGYVPSGPDILLQTDTNSPVSGIPEPAGLALLGIGLAVLGATRRRKADKA